MKIKSSAISLLLTGAIGLSLTGCGSKTPENITDYGGTTAVSETTEETTVTDMEPGNIDTSDISVHDFFGDTVSVDLEMNVNETNLSLHCKKALPLIEHLNVYEISKTRSDIQDEESFVNKIFDGDVTKLTSMDFGSATKYISLMHKYRRIHQILTNEGRGAYIIKPDSGEQFIWEDTDTYSIHLYEGTYDHYTFGLILAYDYVYGFTYIDFEPVDIDEYFPDRHYTTMMVEQSGTPYTDPIENRCELNKEQVYEEANAFLRDRIGLEDYENVITNDSEMYDRIFDDLEMLGTGAVHYDDCLSALTFSDSDYISTYHHYSTQYFGFDILRDQPDQAAEYMESHKSADEMDAVFKVTGFEETDLGTNTTTDGYAVYLGSQFTFDSEANYDPDFAYGINGLYLSDRYENTGIIKMTSNGIFGAELKLTGSVVNVTKNVQLLEFDKIVKSLEAELDENFPASFNGTINLEKIILDYVQVNSPENPDLITVVPTWRFKLKGYANDSSIVYVNDYLINAIDGSVLENPRDEMLANAYGQ